MTNEAIDERVNEDMKNMIQRQLGSGLLRLVDELAMVYSHGYNAKQREQERQLKSPTGVDALPLLLGGTISPALEFVKATTHVLSLDSALEEEVSALKRMLLSQLRVREFNDDSQFKDPCVSYVLSDVICTYCSLCRDYDLLRDPVLSDANLTISERWRCPNCHTAMNLVQVENRLLSEIDKMCTAFLVQDFRCPRTHAVSVRLCAPTSGMYMFIFLFIYTCVYFLALQPIVCCFLNDYSLILIMYLYVYFYIDLCLELAMDKPPSSVRESLRIMHYVSRLHKFTLLEQSVQELSTSGLF